MDNERIVKMLDKVFAWSISRTFSREEAEELTQEIMFQAIRSIDALREEDKFEPWFWRLADVLELGELKNKDIAFTKAETQAIEAATPQGVPTEVLSTLIAYYRANKPEDSDWVVLPVANFDSCFGNTSFSRKWLAKMPPEIIERQKQSYGVCRYKIII